MKIAKIIQGRVIAHFEGTEDQLTVSPQPDQECLVPMPDWAWEHREANIRAGVAKMILIWDYVAAQFNVSRPFNQEQLVEMIKGDLRTLRAELLTLTDWMTSVSDWTMGQELRDQVIAWRQQLRDVTDNPAFQNPAALMELSDNNQLDIKTFMPPMSQEVENLLRSNPYTRDVLRRINHEFEQ